MQVLNDFVLVKPCPSDEITEGGLYIPESARERSCMAEVISVGSGISNAQMYAQVGDTVIHIKGAGQEIIIDDVSHFAIKQIDILAYVTNN